MYSTVAMHVKGASCVNKISNYLAQWTNQNNNTDLDLLIDILLSQMSCRAIVSIMKYNFSNENNSMEFIEIYFIILLGQDN